jgi:hypothetical protein
MAKLIVLIFVLGLLAALLLLLKRLLPARALPYVRRGPLLTPAELAFHQVLEEAVGEQYHIMAMVRLAEIIAVKSGLDPKERFRALNRITSKHIDFVLCRPSDFAVVCAIELDDASHQRADRIDRDRFLDGAMQAAGIPLLHVKVRQSYAPDELRSAIAHCMTAHPAAPVSPQSIAETSETAPTCPNCQIEMVLRTARSGDQFWGCHHYPKCRATRQL